MVSDVNNLHPYIGVQLPATVAFDYPTVVAIAVGPPHSWL